MKITKAFKKVFTAITLSVATLATCIGATLATSVVKAEDATTDATKVLFAGENFTVTDKGKSFAYDADAETPDSLPDYVGTQLSATDTDSNTGKGNIYKAEIQAKFTGTATINFAHVEAQTSYVDTRSGSNYNGRSLYGFRVMSAVDPTVYFDVIWYRANGKGAYVNAAFLYVDEDGNNQIRLFNAAGVLLNAFTSGYSTGAILNVPELKTGGDGSTVGNRLVGLKITNDAGGLSVAVKRTASSYITLAKFDGTTTLDSTTKSYKPTSYNLPKLDFSAGYTVAYFSHYSGFPGLRGEPIHAGYNPGASILFTSISETVGATTQTLDLSGDLPAELPSFVADYQDVYQYDDVTFKDENGNVEANFNAPRYSFGAGTFPDYTAKGENVAFAGWYQEGDTEVIYQPGDAIKTWGVTYLPKMLKAMDETSIFEVTDINGNALNAEQYTVQSNVATLWGQQVTAKGYTTAQAKENLTGTKISVDTETVDAYRVNFKGVFAGSTTIKFDFAEALARTSYYNADRTNNGAFATFRITSALDATKYFDVVYFCASHMGGTLATVVYYDAEGKVVHTKFNASNQPVGVGAYPVVAKEKALAVKQENTNAATGVLNLNNLSGKMVVSVGSVNTMTVASELSDFVFEGGYTVSYLSEVYKPIRHIDENIPLALDEVGLQGTDGNVVHPAYHNLPIMFTSISSGNGSLDLSDDNTNDEPVPAFVDVADGMKAGKTYCVANGTHIEVVDGQIKLPVATGFVAGEVFLGYEMDGKLYAPRTVVTGITESKVFKAVCVTLAVDNTISLRIGSTMETSGIRFKVWVDDADLVASYIGNVGAKISNDVNANVGEQLFADASKKSTCGEMSCYTLAIVNSPNNVANFKVEAFVEVTYYDGSSAKVYANDTVAYTYSNNDTAETEDDTHTFVYTEDTYTAGSYKTVALAVDAVYAENLESVTDYLSVEQTAVFNQMIAE